MLFPLNLWFSCWNHLLSFLFLGASLLSLKVYVGSNEWEGYWERAEMEPSLQIKMHATVERAVNEKIFYGWVGWRWCWGLCGVLTARLRATQWNINSDSAVFFPLFSVCVCVLLYPCEPENPLFTLTFRVLLSQPLNVKDWNWKAAFPTFQNT